MKTTCRLSFTEYLDILCYAATQLALDGALLLFLLEEITFLKGRYLGFHEQIKRTVSPD
jgi:hypothetical protein